MKLLTIASALLSICLGANADDFDFNSQRNEVQAFKKVPGHKIDHKGLVINPTPHSLERHGGTVSFSEGFKVTDKKNAFSKNIAFLTSNKKGLPLTIDFGPKSAAKYGVKNDKGAYALEITPKGVVITGYDETGAFYGLQTLRQIINSEVSSGGELPLISILDYPSLKYRGMVEGFYGTPWSHEARLSQLDFYGENKLNNYIYGPKDDPYHSSPNWRLPYPEEQAKQIKELVERAKLNHVDFVWAIHPGKDIKWNDEDYTNLLNKFQMMYDLGVRAFALFFDDIEGEGTNPAKQTELLNRLSKDFVLAKGDVANILICPTEYSQAWANPRPTGSLAIYGKTLNPNAEVFWTGAAVCSDLTPETLEFIDTRIKRPALYWWNYPVTDYCRNILLQGPVYGLDTSLTSTEVIGIESNPMEHAEASKLALYGVADYAWNIPDYNPIDNWERGLKHIMPQASDAYRTFAIHSADTETGYRRDESWETTIFPFDNYTPAQFENLRNEFIKITSAPDEIRTGATNKALLEEIEPWLVQFEKLGSRGLRTLEAIKAYENGNDSLFWELYSANIMTEQEKKDFEAHKIGTMKLQPFYETAMEGMSSAFMEKLTGEIPAVYHGIGTYANLRTTLPRLMLDNDTTTYYTSAYSQKEGDWIGVDLGITRPVDEIIVHQGRNSVDDVDYFDHVVLEASTDGKTWTPLTDSLKNTYIIKYKDNPVNARFVRIKRLPSKKQNWASVRSFRVNPISQKRLGLNLKADNIEEALLSMDGNPSTFFTLNGKISFDRKKQASTIILLASCNNTPITIEQFDKAGNKLSTTHVNGAYSNLTLNPHCSSLAVNGKATIYEIIQH